MALETGTYISDLVSSNPASSDPLSAADDHLRLIKAAVKNTFPNFTAAALSSTQANLDGAATQYARNGAVPAGAIMDFGMTTAPAGWLACDATVVSRTTFAALFAAIGTTWNTGGEAGTDFRLPNMVSRFRRHRDGSTLAGAVGTLQNPCNLSHTHGVNINSGTESVTHYHGVSITSGNISADHQHTYSGSSTTGNDSPDHTHGFTSALVFGGNPGITGSAVFGVSNQPGTTAGANQRHAHAFSWSGTTSGVTSNHTHDINGNSGTQSAFHTHNVNGNTGTGTADDANEARPYSATVLTCIKT